MAQTATEGNRSARITKNFLAIQQQTQQRQNETRRKLWNTDAEPLLGQNAKNEVRPSNTIDQKQNYEQ